LPGVVAVVWSTGAENRIVTWVSVPWRTEPTDLTVNCALSVTLLKPVIRSNEAKIFAA